MKKLLLTALLVFFILFLSSSLNSQPPFAYDVSVGRQPAMIFESPGEDKIFHVFCMGYDANFDGVYDTESGDEKPSWWMFELSIPVGEIGSGLSNQVKLRDFDYSIGAFTVRPALTNEKIYFSQNGKVISYFLEDGRIADNNVVDDVYPSALSVYGEFLYISLRRQDENDIIAVYDLISKQFVDTVDAYANVQMCMIVNGGRHLLVLNEGNFGEEDSRLQVIDIEEDYKETAVFEIGGAGNFIDYNEWLKHVAVAMNGSHQVQLISLNDNQIVNTFDLPTTGYNGPREVKFDDSGGTLLVSAYDGNIYKIDVSSGEIDKYIECKAKPESFVTDYDYSEIFLVTNIMEKGGYAPDSTVSVYLQMSGVNEHLPSVNINIFPNPASDMLKIEISDETTLESEMQAEIFSENGTLVKKVNVKSDNGSRIILKNLNLSTGAYYLRLISSKRTYLNSFRVAK